MRKILSRIGFLPFLRTLFAVSLLNTHYFFSTDSVVRSEYFRYFHPKEALVSNGVLNRAISHAAGKYVPGLDDVAEKDEANSMSQ